MKLTFPRDKRTITIPRSGAGTLYVIFGRSLSNDFWLQDFWKKPYTFRKYKDAVKGAKVIEKKMKFYKWKDTKPLIAKISF